MAELAGDVRKGRYSYEASAWSDAYAGLSAADRTSALAAPDLELLAVSAYMVGLDDEYVSALERAHAEYLEAGDVPRAVRCAFWIGHNMLFRRRMPRPTGSLG